MIYKAPSIYNLGGGGGGYSEGGALVDGDFIKIENNSVSSYDNTTRSDVNFYFEVGDGEVINSVVEITTTVNATIHVYVLQNNLFIPLGNIGGDSVNAGNDYNLNILGNSFTINQVTDSSGLPEAAIFDGKIYKLTKIGNLLWSDYIGVSTINDDLYTRENTLNLATPKMYRSNDISWLFNDYLKDGWRLPRYTDYLDVIENQGFSLDDLRSNSGWVSIPNGNNSSGLNIRPFGYREGSIQQPQKTGYIAGESFWPRYQDNSHNIMVIGDYYENGSDNYFMMTSYGGWTYLTVRFVKDL